MQLSLVAAFIPIVNILWCEASAHECNYKSFLLNFGYSKECIDVSLSSLISCANNKAPPDRECYPAQENITNILTEVKTLIQEIKPEGENEFEILVGNLENITYRVSSLEVLQQEAKSERENISKSLAAIMVSLEKIIPKKNCADLRVWGDDLSGVRTLFPYGVFNSSEAIVYCDQVTDGGGWTVIQSRSPLPIRENFNRSWNEYTKGFGDPKGEFWLGLDNIHALTNSDKMSLRIDMEDAEGQKRWAKYETFHVGDAASEYVLRIEGYSGTAGDGLTPNSKFDNLNNMKFSTQENDNDLSPRRNCAEDFKGGGWFNDCTAAHLNGLPIVGKDPNYEGIRWQPFRGWDHSLKKASMKIRPVSLGF